LLSSWFIPHRQLLPAHISKPWVKISKKLGLQPVICYAAVELYNHRRIDLNGPWDLR